MSWSRSVIYKGIRFRSVLEAQWAYLMDQIRWSWEYEPHEFGGYIPDFWVKGKRGFFLEVKPARDMNDIEKYLPKLNANLRLRDEILVVGYSWTLSYDTEDPFPLAGWLRQVFRGEGGHLRYKWAWSRWVTCGHCGSAAIQHDYGNYVCYPCGCREEIEDLYDPPCEDYMDLIEPANLSQLNTAWNAAKTEFRWEPR